MMELTAAEPRRHHLTQLFLDGEAAVKIDTETFLRSGLRPGDKLPLTPAGPTRRLYTF